MAESGFKAKWRALPYVSPAIGELESFNTDLYPYAKFLTCNYVNRSKNENLLENWCLTSIKFSISQMTSAYSISERQINPLHSDECTPMISNFGPLGLVKTLWINQTQQLLLINYQ